MTNIKYYLIYPLFLSTLSCFGQRIDTMTIYYPIDDFKFKIENQIQLNNVISAPNIKTIQVLGYADYLGTRRYSLLLSTKRAETVKSFLMKKNINAIIFANGKGQINEAIKIKEGNPKTRKVEIIFNYEELTVLPPTIAFDSIKKEKLIVSLIPSQIDVTKDKYIFKAKVDSFLTSQPGTSITLAELNFVGGTHILTPRSNTYLPLLLKCLVEKSDIKIKIIGHICCKFDGKDGYDYQTKKFELSKNRAKVIYNYLLENGVSSRRMQHKGIGSRNPKVFPEKSNEDSDLNKRVEFLIDDN